MVFFKRDYESPIGRMSLLASQDGLIGAWFVGQKHLERWQQLETISRKTEHLYQAKAWLDAYFSGDFSYPSPSIITQGTSFQKDVWYQLSCIEHHQVATYGQIAKQLGCASAQAVGGAIARNPLVLFIPCHRVVARDGKLTGYVAGLSRKEWLLQHEGIL
ncbi:methylated-DNA--[protein]-cysteine S-methyltransferase [Streptococcus sp. zg-JUN1979]|uniref:methylated-DNA--[protein]-cysteine S-methyltransferase n=1 Tax=Streptococcus sp. zg-JUN1979 TaxID=3391450 RepID=UPI0039A48663